MKFSFQILSVLCMTVISSNYVQESSAAFTDMTTDSLAYLNDKRTTDLGTALSKVAAGDETQKSTLETDLNDLQTNSCADPADDISALGYGRSFTILDDDTKTANDGMGEFYKQMDNYDCIYPPDTYSTKGYTGDFTNIMADTLTHMTCGVNTCAKPVFMCYFTPVFSGDEFTPFDDATWDLLIARDAVCSGDYFSRYGGLLTSIAAFTIGWSYIAS